MGALDRKIHSVYSKTVGKQYDVFALWPPVTELKIGDYGIFNEGTFDIDGNIFNDLKLSPEDYITKTKGTPDDNMFVAHNSVVKVLGQTAIEGGKYKIDLSLDFTSENAFILQARNLTFSQMTYPDIIEEEIDKRWKAKPKKWGTLMRVISKQWEVESYKFAFSTDKKMGLKFNAIADSPTPQIKHMEINLGLEISTNTQGFYETNAKLRPFIRSAFFNSVRKRLQTADWNNNMA
jgi:hypothetical protein